MSRAETLYPTHPDDLRTVEEVAKATGRTPASILQFIQKGILPAQDEQPALRPGRPRKMIRAGDIYLIAFRPRWQNRRKNIRTSTGTVLRPTSVPND
jgi:hypothetical protein